MVHKMSLAPRAFDAIASGRKTVEMRLYDEKRAKIKVGDEIEFENTENRRTIHCSVASLSRYDDFFDLYKNYDKTAIGYGDSEVANAEDMYEYYSIEQIHRYGVLAIEIKLL